MSTVEIAASSAIKFKVKNYIDPDALKNDVAYSLADLSGAQQEQASLYAHYGELAARASRQVNDLKLALEVLEATMYRKERESAAAADIKITEVMLERAIAVIPSVRQLKRLINEAKQIESIAKAAAEAFEHRRDMLIQHGATERQERKGEMRMLGGTADTVEAQKERMLKRIKGGETATTE